MQTTSAIVIDNGSGTIKAGLNSDVGPKVVFPTVAGYTTNIDIRTQSKKTYIGDEVWEKEELLSGIKNPIKRGVIEDFEIIEKIWHHTFYHQLKVKTEDYPVIMTEPPLNPFRNREITTELMFEKYKVPSFYLAIQAILALFESGRTTGLVVDSGYGQTHVCPIYEGYALQHGILSTNIAGNDLTKYMLKLLTDPEEKVKNEQFTTYSFSESNHRDMLILQEMKERFCYSAIDYESEGSDSRENWKVRKEEYILPDKSVITIGKERIKCPEIIFKPSLIGWENDGLHYTVIQSIQKCDSDIVKELQANIVMSGGNTMFDHMSQRLGKELENLSAPTAKIAVHSPPERSNSVWIGAAVLSSLQKFERIWITKKQYEEYGSSLIVHAKCF